MTDFEKKVLKAVSKIPLGEVRTYKSVAKEVGRPRASRAVANALGKNPFPLFIPCHRVIKSSKATCLPAGRVGGYSQGVDLKKGLINLEKKIKNVIK